MFVALGVAATIATAAANISGNSVAEASWLDYCWSDVVL